MTRPALTTGAVLTSSELEGVAPRSEWARWIASGRAPASDDGAGFRSSWRDDLVMLAELGIDEVMVTLEWARLRPEPDASRDRAVESEIEFRRELLTTIGELGMTPWACLVDGSLPGWFVDDERGFTDRKARRLLWPRHVDWIGETFGDLVGGWVPIREPRQWAAWGQLVGATPPGNHRRRDMQKMVQALDEAELEAERLLRGTAPIATYTTARLVSTPTDDVKAKRHGDWLVEHLADRWLRTLSEGTARDAFDRVVAQIRPPISVDGEGDWHRAPDDSIEAMVEPLEALAGAVGDRQFLAAADLAGQPTDGTGAAERLANLIEAAIELGATGWWQASPIDGWHWQHGFVSTPGVFDRDRNRRPAAHTLVDAAS